MTIPFLKIAPLTLLRSDGLLPSLILTGVWYFVFHRASNSKWFLALLAFPGTFVHELVHFLVGLLLLAKPAGLSLRPKRAEGGWILGSVSFRRIGIFNGAFVALAPLLLLPLAWLCLIQIALPFWVEHRWSGWLLAGYLTATLLFSAVPSRQDLKQGGPSILFYGILGGLGWLLSSVALRYWFH